MKKKTIASDRGTEYFIVLIKITATVGAKKSQTYFFGTTGLKFVQKWVDTLAQL